MVGKSLRHLDTSRRHTGGVIVAAGALVAGWAVGAVTSAPATVNSVDVAPSGLGLETNFNAVLRAVVPSVVAISSSSGLGSGVVFDGRGDVVTNAHVVGSSTSFRVTLASGRTVSASLIGAYVPDDLAVIRVASSTGLRPATFGDSSRADAGDLTLAIGNPLGLSSSVTDGIVSFSGRTVSEGNGVVLAETIQTSAAINPGNSGGALVNLSGKVIGIPTLGVSSADTGGAAAGIGFAIPSNTVKLIVPQLIASGRVTSAGRAALGVSVAGVLDASGNPAGVAVVSVERGGPAAKAGIGAGDVITTVNGRRTPDPATLAVVLAGLKPAQRVRVMVVMANGNSRSVVVVLGDLAST